MLLKELVKYLQKIMNKQTFGSESQARTVIPIQSQSGIHRTKRDQVHDHKDLYIFYNNLVYNIIHIRETL